MKIKFCPKCKSELRKVGINIENIKNKTVSYQCFNCDYFSFEPESTRGTIEQLKKNSILKSKNSCVLPTLKSVGLFGILG